jgi:hypothetical protein
MKRHFNIFDGLFLMALYFKVTATGLVLCWAAVFTPYLVEGALALITAYSKLFGWNERVKFWFWNFAKDRAVKRAGTQARAYMKAQEKAGQDQARSGNPGKFVDPKNLGK